MFKPELKIMSLEEAASWAKQLKEEGKTLAVTNGVFDLLHRGHVQYLKYAAEEADELLIALNSDASVRQLKGPDRPVVKEEDRAYILASLEFVSAVVIFDSQKPIDIFKAIAPDVYVKGGDYTEDTLDREEHAILKAAGSRFAFIKFVEGHSTTNVIKKIRSGMGQGQSVDRRIDPIISRRSVRKFQPRPVSRELLLELLKAGMSAPSACAKDPWHFEVITSQDTLKAIASCLPNGGFLANAPACICVAGDIAKAHAGELSYMLQDCSAAAENILLAAPQIGLGGCWLGVHPRQDRVNAIRHILALSENMIPVCCLAIGWPGEHPQARTRFRNDAAHFDF